eukprot:2338126-Pyramimonas_sp.AAC.1
MASGKYGMRCGSHRPSRFREPDTLQEPDQTQGEANLLHGLRPTAKFDWSRSVVRTVRLDDNKLL